MVQTQEIELVTEDTEDAQHKLCLFYCTLGWLA